MEVSEAAGKVDFRAQVQRLALDRRTDTSSVSPRILIMYLCLPVTLSSQFASSFLHYRREEGKKV